MDTGHEQLIEDIEEILAMARNYEFHDYKNEAFSAPKVALANALERMRDRVIHGKYDNEPDEEDKKALEDLLKESENHHAKE